MDLNQFIRIIQNMDRKPFKPHRYLALMAILDIIEKKENPQICPNEFYFDDEYKNYFINYFCKYHSANDNCNSFKPFFHLQNAGGFWFLRSKPGKESDLKKLKEASPGKLNDIVECAKLDKELFDILSKKETGQESREKVRNVIKQCLIAGLRTGC